MNAIKLGCQTYTWQMSGELYLGKLDHIIEVAAKCGFEGIEPEVRFLGALRDPIVMRAHLDRSGIELAAVCIAEDWRGERESDAERAAGDWLIDYLADNFPGTRLNICPMAGHDRADLAERQANLLSCMNALARRAAERGVPAAYHPNSSPGSICRTRDDYEVMLNGLDAGYLKWVPDVGHMAKGGMDPIDVMKTYHALIGHVHFKDMSQAGQWAKMGAGAIDFEAITRQLVDAGYRGWIVVEDESPDAEQDPDAVAAFDANYLRTRLAPLLGRG